MNKYIWQIRQAHCKQAQYKKGFSQLILLIIVGAVVIIAGGSFWYYQQSTEQNKYTPETQATPESSSAPETQTTLATSSATVVPEPSSIKTSLTPIEQEKQTDQNTVTETLAPNVVTKKPTQNSVQTPVQTDVPIKQVPAPTDTVITPIPPTPAPEISCTTPTDTRQMDIFDSHAHIPPTIRASQIISEMNKAGVSVTNIYSGTLETSAQYPGRFITFVDTPDHPELSIWLTQGQSFVTSAESQLKTGKFYGIGEANLRYYSGDIVQPPTVSIPADTPVWLQLVDLSAQYRVPISFHFVPDDSTANAAFERMLSHNKDTVLIWAHLGFNNMPLNSATLNDYLLRYPHLYFDTAGVQNMQRPLPLPNSNWARLADQSNNGKLKEEWKKFFETWNSRILFGSDAGGGANGLERWLNYSSNTSDDAPGDAVGHWKSLLSYLDSNSARNILSANSGELFLKKQKPAYSYSVSSGGKCHSVSVSSDSSVSALTFNSSTRTITFTVADSNATTGTAIVTIPIALGKNFTASVDGKNVESQSTSDSTNTTVSLEYAGGIKLITLSAPATP